MSVERSSCIRIVIKYLQHSTNIVGIKQDYPTLGTESEILLTRLRVGKEQFNMFSVDPKPTDNNRVLYNITSLKLYKLNSRAQFSVKLI